MIIIKKKKKKSSITKDNEIKINIFHAFTLKGYVTS